MNAITPTTAPVATGLPRMNEPAPDFTALTTHGVKSLADYRGKWRYGQKLVTLDQAAM